MQPVAVMVVFPFLLSVQRITKGSVLERGVAVEQIKGSSRTKNGMLSL